MVLLPCVFDIDRHCSGLLCLPFGEHSVGLGDDALLVPRVKPGFLCPHFYLRHTDIRGSHQDPCLDCSWSKWGAPIDEQCESSTHNMTTICEAPKESLVWAHSPSRGKAEFGKGHLANLLLCHSSPATDPEG